ncbi:MAG: hypothetical protein GEU97_18410 [Actinophytocola sp.]|nr:hypothetical protein [Actinophytocola sp.]
MLAASRGDAAADQGHEARRRARDGWYGPGFQAFDERTRPAVWNCEDLAHTARQYERAARNFASALDHINELMQSAMDTGSQAGLEVRGPIIMRPKHPGHPPAVPDGELTPAQADAAYAAYRGEMDSYMPALASYNAGVEAFNTCLEIVRDARNREKQAHRSPGGT